MRVKAMPVFAAGFVLFAAATVQAMEEKKIGFRHTASKELRLDCDNNGNVAFDASDEAFEV